MNVKILKRAAVAAILLCVLAAMPLAAQSAEGTVERYALYVASNKGGAGRETLRYAGSDAQALADTMIEIGGVKRQNSFILVDSTREEIEGAFENITSIMEKSRKSSKRIEFLFYYSGHSDEEALLLGDEAYNYSELKAAISAVPSDVHVVMLDSCFSGNFIRAKGGSREKSFLVDDSTIVQGHAYFSSSSESEASQESDTIGASYFTHSIITGLRGAADTSGDNKVSLNELYYYAFNDTLSQTEKSVIGAQHPSYNITMVGSGDLILTDISVADAVLSIPSGASGQFLVRTLAGKLVSEINKVSGVPVAIALPVGVYQVTVNSAASTTQTTVQLLKGQTTTLDAAGFKQIQQTAGVARGNAAPAVQAAVVQVPVVVTGVTRVYGYDNDYDPATDPYANMSYVPMGAKDTAYLDETTGEVLSYQPFVFSILPKINFPAPGENGNIIMSPFMAEQENVNGLQMASFMGSVNNTFSGVQMSGFMSTLRRGGAGIQLAGFMNNTSGSFTGLQLSFVINAADAINGTQIGLINIANENTGLAVGALNFIGNGIHEFGMYMDFVQNTPQLWFQFQSGAEHLFTTWLCGTQADFKGEYGAFGGGMGWKFGTGGVTFDVEFLNRMVISKSFTDRLTSDDLLNNISAVLSSCCYPTARATLNIGSTNKFSVFASYSADFMMDGWNNAAFSVWKTGNEYDKTIGDKQCKIRTTWSLGFKF